MRAVAGAYLRFGEGIREVTVEGGETLFSEFERFFAGESRLIVAFRHPSVSDAPLLTYLFARHLPRLARRRGRRVPRRTHVHFLYGRGVPVWAGRALGWILPRIAAIPVYHRRTDSRGMGAVRNAAVQGRFPLALAPEGQVSYHNKSFGELEAGTGRIALWCRDDLRAAGRTEDIRILPLALEYRYPEDERTVIGEALAWVEAKTGLRAGLNTGAPAATIRNGLLELTAALLDLIENAYAALFRAPAAGGPPATGGPPRAEGRPGDTGAAPRNHAPRNHAAGHQAALRRRIEVLCDSVLEVGEHVHELPSGGSLLDRVFRLRDAGWRRMFRDDLPGLSPVERSLADAAAEEAKIAARHMELVDVLEYVDPGYIPPGAPLERLVEYAIDLQDVVNRLLGGTIAGRMRVKGRRAVVTAGAPVSVEACARKATGAREAAACLTDYIRGEFERLITPDLKPDTT